MDEWRAHADNGDWDKIHLASLTARDRKAIDNRLRKIVPKTFRSHGMEHVEDYALPHEIRKNPELVASSSTKSERRSLEAAVSLFNDLRWEFEQEPDWRSEARTHAEKILREREKSGKAIECRDAAWHAQQVMDLLGSLDFVLSATDVGHDTDKALIGTKWVRTQMLEAASLGFHIGHYAQAAWGKPHELSAQIRNTHIENRRTFSASGGKQLEDKRHRAIAELGRLAHHEDNLPKWRGHARHHQVTELKNMARSADKDRDAADRLFHNPKTGKLFRDRWFQDVLSTLEKSTQNSPDGKNKIKTKTYKKSKKPCRRP
ncbi:MAG: hypothetical protein KF769_10420 [Parvibaculum sp.]|nr:hypothetical protein [Parvibaculum sp.]